MTLRDVLVEMKVHLSGKQFVFPRACACCGAYPTTTLGVYGLERNKRALTRAWAWDIPYCFACRKHIQAYERAIIGLLSGLVGASLAGIALLMFGDQIVRALFVSGILMITVVTSAAIHLFLLKRRRQRNCIGLTRAVLYLGSTGSCHSFDIRSRFYAADFVRSNYRKLVNISPTVASIVRNMKHSEYQVPRRIVRRRD